MNGLRYGLLLAILVLGCVSTARAQTDEELQIPQMKETDRAAPIDWGFGPGVKPSQAAKQPAGGSAATPTNGTQQTTTSEPAQGGK